MTLIDWIKQYDEAMDEIITRASKCEVDVPEHVRQMVKDGLFNISGVTQYGIWFRVSDNDWDEYPFFIKIEDLTSETLDT